MSTQHSYFCFVIGRAEAKFFVHFILERYQMKLSPEAVGSKKHLFDNSSTFQSEFSVLSGAF
jgi:hypothetical protein